MPQEDAGYILKSPYFLPAILGLGTLFLYLFTLSPTINFGDSPELIASAHTLGISHPPAYPLYSLTGKLFSYLPWGDDIAWRINLASAFFSSASVFLLALILSDGARKTFRSGLIFSALFLAISPTLWSQSVISEVYALNLFFFSLILYLSGQWWAKKDKRFLIAAAFLYGLGLGNHHTLIAFLPLLILFLVLRKGQGLNDIKLYFTLIVFFALGITVYIYLPLRSLQSPPMDWGDPESLHRFLDVVLRRQFPTGSSGLSFQKAMNHLYYYLNLLKLEFTLPVSLIGLWGLIRSYKAGLPPFLFLLALFIIHGMGTLLFLNPSADMTGDINVMMIPSFFIFALWIGWGVRDIISRLSTRRGAAYSVTALAILLLALFLYKGVFSFQNNNQRNNYFALDYAANIFQTAKENSVIFVEADTSLFPLWYLQYVQGLRPDVAVIDVDFLMLPWFKGQIHEKYPNIRINVEDLGKHASGKRKARNYTDMLDSYKVAQLEVIANDLIDKRPLYISYEFGPVYRRLKENKETYVIDHGLVYKVSKRFEKPDVTAWDKYNLRTVMNESILKDSYTKVLSLAYIQSMKRRARVLILEGNREEARKVLDRANKLRAEAAALF